MKLEVHAIGSKVKIGEDVNAIISSININGGNNVSYECGWWNGRSYDTRIFHSSEIEVALGDRLQIGFI